MNVFKALPCAEVLAEFLKWFEDELFAHLVRELFQFAGSLERVDFPFLKLGGGLLVGPVPGGNSSLADELDESPVVLNAVPDSIEEADRDGGKAFDLVDHVEERDQAGAGEIADASSFATLA